MGNFLAQLVGWSIFIGVLYLIGQVFEKAGSEILILGAIIFGMYVLAKASEK